MTNALAIDTTSQYLSLGLMKDGRTVAQHYDPAGKEMNRTILTVIDGMLKDARLTTHELDVIVAARGPGSFTGTRIGLALARSFSQVRGLPLVGVDTLRLLAAQAAPEQQGDFHAVLNCIRGEVYHARYCWSDAGLVALGEIAVSTFDALPGIAGDDPVVLRRFPPEQPGHEASLGALRPAVLRHPHPDATLLMEQGMALFHAGADGAAPPPAEPIYLKSEAFRKWKV